MLCLDAMNCVIVYLHPFSKRFWICKETQTYWNTTNKTKVPSMTGHYTFSICISDQNIEGVEFAYLDSVSPTLGTIHGGWWSIVTQKLLASITFCSRGCIGYASKKATKGNILYQNDLQVGHYRIKWRRTIGEECRLLENTRKRSRVGDALCPI